MSDSMNCTAWCWKERINFSKRLRGPQCWAHIRNLSSERFPFQCVLCGLIETSPWKTNCTSSYSRPSHIECTHRNLNCYSWLLWNGAVNCVKSVTLNPAPTGPSTLLAGTRTSSNVIVRVSEHRWPMFFSLKQEQQYSALFCLLLFCLYAEIDVVFFPLFLIFRYSFS